MALQSFVVRPGPEEYECREGVVDTLPDRLEDHAVKRAVLVHGTRSWANARPFLDALMESDIELTLVTFNGEATYAEMDRVASIARAAEADAIIGVGGGKLVDTVKHVANDMPSLYSVVIPTLASNCAPWAPLTVIYTEEGVFSGVDVLKREVSLLLVDPRIVVTAPSYYLVAGIGDTIAKWYESDKILSGDECKANAFMRASRSQAWICKQNCVEYGAQALADCDAGNASTAFMLVAETVIALAGLVGGFGDIYARATIAHAIHDAITAFPETHEYLHGTKVAYGVMVQLAYEEEWEELDALVPFYEATHLPRQLADLDIAYLDDAQLDQMAEDAQNDALLKMSVYDTTPARLRAAVVALEEHFKTLA